MPAPPAPRRAEVEQVVDDARQPVALAHHALGELLVTSDSSVAAIVSASTASAPIGVLQLVTHVGDEVAAHALDPARLGDVADERDRTADDPVATERERAQLQHLPRRAVELELALRGSARAAPGRAARRPRPRRDFAVARAAEAARGALRTTSWPSRSTTTIASVAASSAAVSRSRSTRRLSASDSRPAITSSSCTSGAGSDRRRAASTNAPTRARAACALTSTTTSSTSAQIEQRERRGRHPNRPVM